MLNGLGSDVKSPLFIVQESLELKLPRNREMGLTTQLPFVIPVSPKLFYWEKTQAGRLVGL